MIQISPLIQVGHVETGIVTLPTAMGNAGCKAELGGCQPGPWDDVSFSRWSRTQSLEPITVEWASQVALGVKNPSADSGDRREAGSTPRSGRSPGEGNANPLQYSCLDNPMDRGYSPWGHKESDTSDHTAHSTVEARPCQEEASRRRWGQKSWGQGPSKGRKKRFSNDRLTGYQAGLFAGALQSKEVPP